MTSWRKKIFRIKDLKHYSYVIDSFVKEMENPSWVLVRNGVHRSEFVFQKSWTTVGDFCGIQTHKGELCSAQAPIINSVSSTMLFSYDNFTKTSEITLKSSEITVRGRKSQLSVGEKVLQN